VGKWRGIKVSKGDYVRVTMLQEEGIKTLEGHVDLCGGGSLFMGAHHIVCCNRPADKRVFGIHNITTGESAPIEPMSACEARRRERLAKLEA
jgi:hypothetical protein